ncbi:MAG: GH3 auxin-responsive promoter family protein [Pseudomonadota bacterium]
MARPRIPRWVVAIIRVLWGVARVLPAPIIRFLGRLLFSKSQARFEAALADPRGTQTRHLLEILRRHRDTSFGREHGFEEIRDWAGFRARVPIRGYDQLEPYLKRMVAGERDVLVSDPVTFFARSSGTTGSPKYIPVTEPYLDEMRAVRRAWSRAVSQVFPGLVRGHFLTVHSPTIDGHTPGGVPYGSITVALSGGTDDDVASPLEGIPRAIHRLRDLDTKYYLILRAALDLPISLMGALNPSTVLLLCQRLTRWADRLATDLEQGTLSAPGEVPADLLARMAPRLARRPEMARRLRRSLAQHGVVRPGDLWPRLCGVLTWKGGSAPFYLGKLRAYLAELPILDYGYVASEGAFSVVLDAGDGRGVVGIQGHVLEFVPEAMAGQADTEALLVDELRIGERYAVIITAGNGLYRYDINDIVEVVDLYRGVPRIRFVHKGGNMISITGEKLGEAHAVEAIDGALRATGVDAAGFLLTARLEDPPYYVVAVEIPGPIQDSSLQALLHACDLGLQQVNIEYAAKRNSQRLGSPHLVLTSPGVFEGLRAQRVAEGAPDAHVKVPHLWRDAAVLERLGVQRELMLETP